MLTDGHCPLHIEAKYGLSDVPEAQASLASWRAGGYYDKTQNEAAAEALAGFLKLASFHCEVWNFLAGSTSGIVHSVFDHHATTWQGIRDILDSRSQVQNLGPSPGAQRHTT